LSQVAAAAAAPTRAATDEPARGDRYLLDTCTFLWMLAKDELLGPEARRIVSDPQRCLFLSAASAWEIALKARLGKLDLGEPPASYVLARMDSHGVDPLAITHAHALATGELPPHHRDPFDRLLVAQAQQAGLVLVSPDPAFAPYAVRVVW
jgi:PIN domain nuclease of toxin-antitoxin system